jgi:hypothetical protein
VIAQMELDIQRRLTDAFILADQVEIVLTRQVKVSDGAGGFTVNPTPLPVQRFRLIPQQDTQVEVETADGRMVRPRFVLLGRHTADMERRDTFTWNGERYELGQVADKQYEIKAEVAYLGRV